ncbi:MAG: squalene--hopene cyclase [Bryobacteraceae bacterium]
MGGFELVQPAGPRRRAVNPQTLRAEAQALQTRRQEASQRAADALLRLQTKEGYWVGDLIGDVSLEADYVLLQLWMHQPHGSEWNPPNRVRIERCCKSILDHQLPDGGFALYPGGPSEISLSVKAYTALKLGGRDPESTEMVKLRDTVLRLGGVQACNSYTKINLSLFELYPRRFVPTVPPEIVLLPAGILYEMSSWTRAIVVPLTIVQATGRKRKAPDGFNLDELFVPGKKLTLVKKEGLAKLFIHLDRLVKLWDKRGLKNLRAVALREAEQWILARTRNSDGLGAIYPSMMYHIMALDSLGYASDHPDFVEAVRQLDCLLTETDDRFFFQPCFSPVWDTAIAAFALGEGGLAEPKDLSRAADWLISKQIRRKGDWAVKRPYLEPGGWVFEFDNEYYPDIDDTAMVLLALLHAKSSDTDKQAKAVRRAVNWLLGMQSRDGGWAAFDVDNNWQILNKLPFADHNAMLDPTCPDITGRVIEALVRNGVPSDDTAIRNGVKFLLGCQETNGSWYGRWGVNYIYGTFLALRGLKASGNPAAESAMKKAAEWIRSVQNSDGGWGESHASYVRNCYVAQPSTASQTAWALLGLVAAGEAGSPAARRGCSFLLDTQLSNGDWAETPATGTGFPNVYCLRYDMYRHYFPLLALVACNKAQNGV